MSLVATRLAAIKPSPTLAVAAKAAQLKSEGKDIIGLGAGEPDFDTPQFIKDAAVEAMNKGLTKYTPAGGTVSLKKAIIAKFKRDNGLDYTPKQILVSCGGKHTSFNLCLALLNPGDEVIIPAPYWVSYPDMAVVAEAKPVFIQRGHRAGLQDHRRRSSRRRSRRSRGSSSSTARRTPRPPSTPSTELKALGEVLQEAPAHRHRERRHVRADPARRLEVREHPQRLPGPLRPHRRARTASPRPTR